MRRGVRTWLAGMLVLVVMMGGDPLRRRAVTPGSDPTAAPVVTTESGAVAVGSDPTAAPGAPMGSDPMAAPDAPMESEPAAAGSDPDLVPQVVAMDAVAELVPPLDALSGGVAYRVAEGQWGGFQQKIHVLTIDPAAEAVQVRPVFSFNQLFGFETLSVMAGRAGAIAAVNGGFAYTDGRPAGTVMLDGVLHHPSDPRFPSLLFGDGRVSFAVLETPARLSLGTQTLAVDALNPWPIPEGISLVTPVYGSTDRLEAPHLVLRIARGKVLESLDAHAPVSIPDEGFLVVARGAQARERLAALREPGLSAAWDVTPEPGWPADTRHAVACGSFLVRDGVSVVPEWDAWIGPMAGLAPRTVVGIGGGGQLVFVVAEGRIPDGPAGLSGEMLGALLVEMGLVEAAMLDGGASSQMLMGDTVVNHLSAGRERLLSSGFVLLSVSAGAGEGNIQH